MHVPRREIPQASECATGSVAGARDADEFLLEQMLLGVDGTHAPPVSDDEICRAFGQAQFGALSPGITSSHAFGATDRKEGAAIGASNAAAT